MPIQLPHNLPAVETLQGEHIAVLTDGTQAGASLRILLLNIMPKKIETETQFARLLGNTPLDVELQLIRTKSHESKNVAQEHLLTFYKTFEDIKAEYFDGLIITGAPVEHLAFEEVDYWQELCEIMEWSKTHVHSVMHVCWGAQAGLYYHYGIQKHEVPAKLFGVFPHVAECKYSMLLRGFDDVFMVPQSRHTTVLREDIEKVEDLIILSSSEKTGVYAVASKDGRQIFVTGHSEYDADTLKNEYLRDLGLGKPIEMPENYFKNDDPSQEPVLSWRGHAHLLFSNWLNYFVYQSTPYDIKEV